MGSKELHVPCIHYVSLAMSLLKLYFLLLGVDSSILFPAQAIVSSTYFYDVFLLKLCWLYFTVNFA